MTINIIGAGFAGSEIALQLAKHNIKVNLYEMRPLKSFGPFGNNGNFAYPVCSNSFKSVQIKNAHGVFKAELFTLKSELLKYALKFRVPAGKSLSIDRNRFSEFITETIENNPYINVIRKEVSPNELEGITIIATGPLSSEKITNFLLKQTHSKFLYFYDAVSPIVTFSSINMNKCFWGSRYNKGNDYINCPMTKEEYEIFYNEVIKSEQIASKDFENMQLFNGCMPFENIAKSGYKSLLFGVMKPVGFDKKYYAIVQLRKENNEGTMFNLVGFQTKLRFPDQKRIVSLIPGLENAEIVRYGVIHKNIYINSPEILNSDLSLKKNKDIYLAGQITGSEGYIEAIGIGLFVALSIIQRLNNKTLPLPPRETILGSLLKYLLFNENEIKPMNANFGLLDNYNKRNKINIAKNCIVNIYKWYNEYFN